MSVKIPNRGGMTGVGERATKVVLVCNCGGSVFSGFMKLPSALTG